MAREELFDDTGAKLGRFITTDDLNKPREKPKEEPIVHEVSPDGAEEEVRQTINFNDMDKSQEPHTTSDVEAKLKVADYIVRPKGKYNLRQMSRVSPQDEKILILLELQTESHKLLSGKVKDEDGNPILLGDMILDTAARYSRARDGGLIVDALKVIQIEGEKEEESKGPHWG
jgi:hypothetical protein